MVKTPSVARTSVNGPPVPPFETGFRPANAYSYDDLIACGEGRMFGPGNAQLPLPPFLMFDRIEKINADKGRFSLGEIVASKTLSEDDWFFKCHFQGDPVMPGCLGLDALWQLLGFFLAWKGFPGRGRALGVEKLRFRDQIFPEVDTVVYRLDIQQIVDRRVKFAVAAGEVIVDDRPIYTAGSLRAGVFVL